jgi:hypothetical protein
MYAIPAESLTEFTNAIQGIQNQMALLNFQMTNMAQRLTAIDGRDLPPAAHLPQITAPARRKPPRLLAPVSPPYFLRSKARRRNKSISWKTLWST